MVTNPDDITANPENYIHWEATPSIAEGSELDLRIRAVEAAVRLYADKAATNLKDYNEKFEELTTKIYTFYVSTKELH